MNRFFKYLLMAVALLSVSCQKDMDEVEYANVTVRVQTPASVGTRAYGDGMSADNLVFGVFDETGAELPDLRQGDWTKSQTELTFDKVNSEGKPYVDVTVRLVKGKSYTFVCWAQNKSVSCYDFTDLNKIKVDYTKDNVANNESRDAFFACVSSGVIVEGVVPEVTLKRPFAQLNVGTSPEDFEAARAAGLDVDNIYIEVSVTNASSALVTDHENLNYNVSTELVAASFDAGLAPVSISAGERFVAKIQGIDGAVTEKEYEWLGMNYIFTSLGKDDNKDVTFTLYEGNPAEDGAVKLVSYTQSNVWFQANWRTNLVGNLLTADGGIEVFVSPIFDGEAK